MRTVFASRHGSVNESIEMIEQVVRRERLSPAQFSHTVHNAQAGLFCIAAQNRSASCSIAGRADTFACGWLEVLAHLERDPATPVLYVMADVQLAPRFAALVDEPREPYALALLIARTGDGPELRFDLEGVEETPVTPWPHAGVFLRWMLSDDGAPLPRALPLDAVLMQSRRDHGREPASPPVQTLQHRLRRPVAAHAVHAAAGRGGGGADEQARVRRGVGSRRVTGRLNSWSASATPPVIAPPT